MCTFLVRKSKTTSGDVLKRKESGGIRGCEFEKNRNGWSEFNLAE